MNRLTRISSILIQLQSKKVITAREIADRFDISLRTVYRDIKTLEDAGVPIGSQNGTGYFIVDGYSLPPIMITEEEANALIVCEKLIAKQGDTSLKTDFNSVLIKIKAVLADFEKENIEILEKRIDRSQHSDIVKSNSLPLVQKAITNSFVLDIKYHSIYKDEEIQREIEPLGVYFTDKVWVVIAHCRLRDSLREFRLDRIVTIKNTAQTFDYEADFDLVSYFKNVVK